MIKLKGLIKEEIRHACECGGDCCKTTVNESLQLPNGTEIQVDKVFTGQGKAFVKEEDLNKKKSPKREKLKTEAIEQETNIPFEMIGKSYISIKGRKLTAKLQFKGNDLQDVVNGKKKKGKVVLASVTTK